MTDALSGITVLVTRPSHQADNLVRLIESHGGEALRFPTLEIESADDREAILAQVGDAGDYDIAIFISINAVNHGIGFLPTAEPRPQLAAIGPSTARALKEAGFETDIKATRGFTSEALLREPALRDVKDKKILIFRGSGGRALLGRELEERGASVTYAEVYRRDRPDELDPAIEKRLAEGSVDIVTATSAETLFNLYELADDPGAEGLLDTQLVTASERVVKKATALGFRNDALLADSPDDQGLVEAILAWRSKDDPTETPTDTIESEPSMQEHESLSEDKDDPAVAEDLEETVDETVAEEPVATPPPKRAGGALGLLAVLIALAALAASAHLWWQQRQKDALAEQAAATAGDALAMTGSQLAALDDRLDDNLSRVSSLDASRGRIESAIDDLRGSIDTLTARVQGVEQSIDDVRGVSASARNNWVRAEAEYFLQTANSRLQLAHDPDAALAALLAADDRLKALGDPTLFRVRQELATEIAALRAVPRPDIEGIAHTLNGLAARVDELPLDNSSPEGFSSGDEPAAELAPVDRAKAAVKNVFTSMVSVKRTDEAITPLLSRDEEFFLRRNLELQLHTARLALLRGDAANYAESLRTARNWLQAHFTADTAAVRGTIETLANLESEDIQPDLPDISRSLRLLRLAAPVEEAPVAPVVPEAPEAIEEETA